MLSFCIYRVSVDVRFRFSTEKGLSIGLDPMLWFYSNKNTLNAGALGRTPPYWSPNVTKNQPRLESSQEVTEGGRSSTQVMVCLISRLRQKGGSTSPKSRKYVLHTSGNGVMGEWPDMSGAYWVFS